MAKAKGKSAALVADKGDDLFAAATAKTVAAPKKAPGTVFALPKNLKGDGELDDESALLHNAVHDVIDAKEEEDKAKNRSNLAKSVLNPYVIDAYAGRVASAGCLPTTPIVLVNWKGESLTYVIQDRTSSTGLNDEQLQMLRDMLGADTVERITMKTCQYGFDPDTMNEIAGEIPVGVSANEAAALPRVFNVVAKRVSTVLNEAVAAGEITQEQKTNLLTANPKTLFKKGVFADLAQFTGADVSRIKGVLEALGSAVVRYLKA